LAVGVEEGKSESEDVHMFTNTVAPFTFTQTVGIWPWRDPHGD